MKQDPRECQPLLLAPRQYLVPGRVLLDAVNQVVEADEFQCPPNFLYIFFVRRPRIGDSS